MAASSGVEVATYKAGILAARWNIHPASVRIKVFGLAQLAFKVIHVGFKALAIAYSSCIEGQGPVGMSTTAIILAQFKVAILYDPI